MRLGPSALLLLLLAAPPPDGGVLVDRVAASVNDTAIPESEVRRAMLLSPLRPEPGETPEAFRTRIVNALIDQHLQYEDALRFGPAPPDAAEVSAALERLRERLRAEGKDPAAEFAAAGLTPEQVRASVERQLIISRYLRERFRPTTFVGEDGCARRVRFPLRSGAAGGRGVPVPAVRAGLRGNDGAGPATHLR